MDPEDVAAILRPYHARVRTELERYGGTVEKFIGDAVMALFGAPVRTRTIPSVPCGQRSPSASLRSTKDSSCVWGSRRARHSCSSMRNRMPARAWPPGDVVNTAARLQSAAPVNGVLVDETTYRATRHAVDYEDAEAVEAKGKTEPIAVWQAQTAHSRFGVDVAHEARAELVGRERELSVIRDAFERARHERTPQLLTLVGVPGIGKSRLVYELSRIADADPELVTWRQGRCLAYGDGVTLWALSEIVKAQSGIVEQDTPARGRAEARRGCRRRPGRYGRHELGRVAAALARRPRGRVGARRRPPTVRLRRLETLSRGNGRAAAARRRLRGPPLGGREPARLRGRARRLGHRRPAAGGRDREA